MLVPLRLGVGCLLAATLLTGCGRRSQRTFEDRAIVTGTVTVQGSPLPEGQIVFESSDDVVKGIPPGIGQIVDGRYRASVAFGSKTVRISSRPPGRKSASLNGIPPDDVPPPEYQETGRFVAVIEQNSPQTFDFDVTSSSAQKKTGLRSQAK